MLGAFADRVDVRRADAAEIVPDHDAPVDAEPRPAGELDIRPDSGGEHDHVALERAAVLERHAGDMPVAEHGRGERLEVQLHTHLGELPLEDRAGRGIELRVHDVRHEVHDVHVDVAVEQTACGLEPEQAAADDHRAPRVARERHDPVAVVERTEDEDAVAESAAFGDQAIHARDDRLAARRHHQRVVLVDGAVGAAHAPGRRGRSRRPARPACSVTPRAAYQDKGLMRMSAGL